MGIKNYASSIYLKTDICFFLFTVWYELMQPLDTQISLIKLEIKQSPFLGSVLRLGTTENKTIRHYVIFDPKKSILSIHLSQGLVVF